MYGRTEFNTVFTVLLLGAIPSIPSTTSSNGKAKTDTEAVMTKANRSVATLKAETSTIYMGNRNVL